MQSDPNGYVSIDDVLHSLGIDSTDTSQTEVDTVSPYTESTSSGVDDSAGYWSDSPTEVDYGMASYLEEREIKPNVFNQHPDCIHSEKMSSMGYTDDTNDDYSNVSSNDYQNNPTEDITYQSLGDEQVREDSNLLSDMYGYNNNFGRSDLEVYQAYSASNQDDSFGDSNETKATHAAFHSSISVKHIHKHYWVNPQYDDSGSSDDPSNSEEERKSSEEVENTGNCGVEVTSSPPPCEDTGNDNSCDDSNGSSDDNSCGDGSSDGSDD